jgi:hypothetical protein
VSVPFFDINHVERDERRDIIRPVRSIVDRASKDARES